MRHPSLAAALAAAALLSFAAPVAYADDEAVWRATTTASTNQIDAFSKPHAPLFDMDYVSAHLTLLLFAVPTVSACGADSGQVTEDHAFCSVDDTVYIDLDSDGDHSVATLLDDGRDVTVSVILAHEYGHHVQNLLGVLDNPAARSIDIELQADCLSGYYMASSPLDGDVNAQLDEIVQFSIEAADPTGTRASDPDAHGNAAQRAEAFLHGFNADPNGRACGI